MRFLAEYDFETLVKPFSTGCLEEISSSKSLPSNLSIGLFTQELSDSI